MTKVDLQVLSESLEAENIEDAIKKIQDWPYPENWTEADWTARELRSRLLHVLRFIKQTTAD